MCLWLERIKHFNWSDSTQRRARKHQKSIPESFLWIRKDYLCCFRSFSGCFSITRLEDLCFFSPDHNQAPISSSCSGWKAISCIPADVLWDMNDLIKSHAKGPEMSDRACGRWKLPLVPSRQEMCRRVGWAAQRSHWIQTNQCFMSWWFPTYCPWKPLWNPPVIMPWWKTKKSYLMYLNFILFSDETLILLSFLSKSFKIPCNHPKKWSLSTKMTFLHALK